jgi:monoamine oxidase
VTNHLVKLFGTEASLPIGYLEKNWCEDEWSEGAYFALMKQCTHLKDMLHLRTPFGRIHWAGTETATQWYGYMDGAIDSGFRCAHEIFAQ